MYCSRCNTDWCWLCRMKTPDGYDHFDSLFGCYGMMDGCGSYYFVILLIQLLYLAILPIVVFIEMLDKMKGFYGSCLSPCVKVIKNDDEINLLSVSLLVGMFVLPFAVLVAAVVSVPVYIWQIYKILYSFSMRYIFCCCC